MKNILIYGVGAILLYLLLKKPVKTMVKLSRGYRNNNPGNIVKTFSNGKQTFWIGEISGSDSRFKTFKNMAFGYRAIFVTLNSYINKGFNTIEKIINRYAPPNENKTSSYVNHVAEMVGVDKDFTIDKSDNVLLLKIVEAISYVENGIKPDKSQILKGYELFIS